MFYTISGLVVFIMVSSLVCYCNSQGISVRLVGGGNRCEGLLKVSDPQYMSNDAQGCSLLSGVCEAKVICRQLGCSTDRAMRAADPIQYGFSSDVRVYQRFGHKCTGNEQTLSSCPDYGANCPVPPQANYAIAINCNGPSRTNCFRCPALTSPRDGSIDYHFFFDAPPYNLGSVANFHCQPGFSLHGAPARLTCTKVGTTATWGDSEPTCVSTVCPAIDHPANGYVYFSMRRRFTSGTVATFECNSQYYLNGGADTLTCQDDDEADTTGAWSGPEPTCEPFKCLDLDRPTNGEVHYSSMKPLLIGTVATFECESGYYLNGGANTLICQVDDQANTKGAWSGPEPTCEPFKCLDLDHPTNGDVQYSMEPLLIETVATFSCESGFFLSGAMTLTCLNYDQAQTGGTWDGSEPTCEPFQCPALTAPMNGSVSYSTESPFNVGTVATFTCNSGFSLNGALATLTCGDGYDYDTEGNWDETEPACLPFQCPALTAPMDGSLSYSTDTTSPFNVGTVATFTCDPGFSLNGAPSTLNCGDGYQTDTNGRWLYTQGYWDRTNPTCSSFQCPALTAPMEGSVSYTTDTTSPFDVGTIATFTCDPGFSLNGATNTLNCGDGDQTDTDGHWDRSEPTCQPFQCPALTVLTNAIISYSIDTTSPFDVDTVATFTCNAGFSLNGAPNTLTCGDGDQRDTVGHWSGTVPSCQSFQCPSLTAPIDGSVSYSTDTTSPFSIGTVATFSCDSGFSLGGAVHTLKCVDGDQSDTEGHWDGAQPTCQSLNIQLHFQVKNCNTYKQIDPESKTNEITNALAMAVDQLCGCGFNSSLISDSFICCFNGSPQHVTYRAVLIGTPSINVSSVALYLNQWIKMNGTIVVQSTSLRINSTCPLVIVDRNSPECPECLIYRHTTPTYTSPMNPTSNPIALANSTSLAVTMMGTDIGIAIGGVFGGLAGPVAIIVIISSVIVICTARSKWISKEVKIKHITKPIKMVVLSDVTDVPSTDPVNEYKTLGQYQEETYDKPRTQSGNPDESAVVPDSTNVYSESLDKYNDESYKPMDRPHPPTRNYELKTCAAYGPPPASICDNAAAEDFV